MVNFFGKYKERISYLSCLKHLHLGRGGRVEATRTVILNMITFGKFQGALIGEYSWHFMGRGQGS